MSLVLAPAIDARRRGIDLLPSGAPLYGGAVSEESLFQSNLQRLDALVQEFESLPFPQIREKALELLQLVDAAHREPLRRLVQLLREDEQAGLLRQAASDPVIRALLLLYELLPEAQEHALDALGGDGAAFIPIAQVGLQPQRESREPAFRAIPGAEQLQPGALQVFEVAGAHVLVANIDGRFYAARNQCPHSMAPLHLGAFTPPVLTCPWHNEPYDLGTGERVDGVQGARLTMLPIALGDGEIHVALAAPSASPLSGQP